MEVADIVFPKRVQRFVRPDGAEELTERARETVERQKSITAALARQDGRAPASTSPLVRPGWSSANRCAIVELIECPTMTAGPTSRQSSKPARSSTPHS